MSEVETIPIIYMLHQIQFASTDSPMMESNSPRLTTTKKYRSENCDGTAVLTGDGAQQQIKIVSSNEIIAPRRTENERPGSSPASQTSATLNELYSRQSAFRVLISPFRNVTPFPSHTLNHRRKGKAPVPFSVPDIVQENAHRR